MPTGYSVSFTRCSDCDLPDLSPTAGQRFPLRPRNYLDHLPKAIGAPLLQEASIMFASDLNDAAQRHFRESTYGVGDISMAFLTTHMRIERWREALLWTWVVARLGAREEGKWGDRARNEVQDVLGLDRRLVEGMQKVKIRRAERDTLKDVPKQFAKAKWEPPLATSFRFCMCSSSCRSQFQQKD